MKKFLILTVFLVSAGLINAADWGISYGINHLAGEDGYGLSIERKVTDSFWVGIGYDYCEHQLFDYYHGPNGVLFNGEMAHVYKHVYQEFDLFYNFYPVSWLYLKGGVGLYQHSETTFDNYTYTSSPTVYDQFSGNVLVGIGVDVIKDLISVDIGWNPVFGTSANLWVKF